MELYSDLELVAWDWDRACGWEGDSNRRSLGARRISGIGKDGGRV